MTDTRTARDGEASRPATLKDVAALAGVSTATVSKALNGRQHVRAETRIRVQAAADELRFSPNALAKGLLEGRTGTVGLLTSDLEGRFSLPVLMGAEDAFGAGRTSVLLCDARGDSIREQHHVQTLLARRVDGLIMVGDKTNPRPPLQRSLAVPVVYAYAPSSSASDISVISDNVGAGRIAAEHVLASGRRRIAYISGDVTYAAARDRVHGAMSTLREAGLALESGQALFGAWNEAWGRGATHSLLVRHPDIEAILCGSDQIARGVMDALRELGLDVPRDIAVMGHDNWEPIAEYARPPLSTIDMQLEQLGRAAASLLYAAIAGEHTAGVHAVGTRLVTRGSTVVSS